MSTATTKRCVPLVAALIAFSCSAGPPAKANNPYTASEIVFGLSDVAKSDLGASLGAIALLADWSPHIFIPLSYLESSGKIRLIRELERAKLVIVHETQGLPDGTESHSKQIRIQPIGKGLEIVATFQALLDEIEP